MATVMRLLDTNSGLKVYWHWYIDIIEYGECKSSVEDCRSGR